ncbi:ChaN family lipoprotein [Gemmobacter sp.]|uniref:ChaN family lipoprotein n=1 Tax=Gemmobacter sp. TaxID=1898957 RepID=UPI002AFE3A4F|nr:ChaN family lipoprotein [Gemmobacter sp.]
MKALLALLLTALPALAGPIAPADLAAAVQGADVVVLGEVHDNPAHHAHQAQAVAALRPAALVFEMLTPDQAARVTPEVRTDAVALEAALGWVAAGWPDFAMYHPIFLAAPGAVVHGAALPRDQVRQAVRDGAAAVFGADAAAYGLDRALPPEDLAARIALQDAAHCGKLPAALLPGMVEAQRLRDAALARAVVQAMAKTGGPVAVITGTGHARRDQGVPAALALAAPGLRVLAVGQLEADPGPDAPFDLWIVSPAPPRGDPCAAL